MFQHVKERDDVKRRCLELLRFNGALENRDFEGFLCVFDDPGTELQASRLVASKCR
jgi:hypothetical protein